MIYIFITSVISHWINFFSGVILFYMLYKLADYFNKPLIQVKVLDNITKSPIYSEFSAAIDGLIPIRCYQQGGNFLKKFSKLVNNKVRTELGNITV